MNNYRINMGNITRVIKCHITNSCSSFTQHDDFSIVQPELLWKHFIRTFQYEVTLITPSTPSTSDPRPTTLLTHNPLDPQPLDPQPLDSQPPRPTIKNLLIVAIFMVCYLRGGGWAVDYSSSHNFNKTISNLIRPTKSTC